MAILFKKHPIEKQIEDVVTVQQPRPYLGMSQLGAKCKRQLWYSFRSCFTSEYTARKMRIFARGDLEEPRVLKDLEAIGTKILSTQETYVGFAGHCKGHSDGSIHFEGQDYLLEIKTAKHSSFKQYHKKKCKGTNEQYYAQIQVYMLFSGLKECLFIVTNKDTEERYYEIIPFNEGEAKEYESVAQDVIATDVPPPKIAGPEWFECKWCDSYDICHFNAEITPTCRNCQNGEIHMKGEWKCSKFNKILTTEEQLEVRELDSCYDKLTALSTDSSQ